MPKSRHAQTHSILYQIVFYTFVQQVVLAGLGHRKLANGNILPGVVDAARRLLASAKKDSTDRVSASEVQLRPPAEHIPSQLVHLTQRQLPAPVGSRVRGVEMLPSVDVPNIPATTTNELIMPSRMRSPLAAHRKSHSVIQIGVEQFEEQQRPSLPANGIGTDSRILQRPNNMRPDLFRKKDSPQEAAAKAGRSPRPERMVKSKSVSTTASTASASSTTASSADKDESSNSQSVNTTGSTARIL